MAPEAFLEGNWGISTSRTLLTWSKRPKMSTNCLFSLLKECPPGCYKFSTVHWDHYRGLWTLSSAWIWRDMILPNNPHPPIPGSVQIFIFSHKPSFHTPLLLLVYTKGSKSISCVFDALIVKIKVSSNRKWFWFSNSLILYHEVATLVTEANPWCLLLHHSKPVPARMIHSLYIDTNGKIWKSLPKLHSFPLLSVLSLLLVIWALVTASHLVYSSSLTKHWGKKRGGAVFLICYSCLPPLSARPSSLVCSTVSTSS